MSKTIKPEDLSKAIQEELTLYHKSVIERINEAGKASIEKLKKLTKASAPKRTGDYRKNIAVTERESGNGSKVFIWYVKKPYHRLTHLLVKSHPTGNGGMTKANPFLENALKEVLPEYEEAVEEAIKQ